MSSRSRVPTQTLPAPSPMTSQTSPIYATSSLQPQKERVLPAPTVPSQGSVDASNSYYPATSINSGPIDDLPSATGNLFDSKIFNAGPSLAPPSVTASSSTEDEEEGSKKKKVCCVNTTSIQTIIFCVSSSPRSPISESSTCALPVAGRILLSGER